MKLGFFMIYFSWEALENFFTFSKNLKLKNIVFFEIYSLGFYFKKMAPMETLPTTLKVRINA